MKKLYFILVLTSFLFLQIKNVIGQVNIFPVETMGTVGGTTAIASHTGWVNNATLSFTGTGDVRSTTVSTGYAGASGNANVFLTTSSSRSLLISTINTSSHTSLSLSFGVYKSTTTGETGTSLAVEVSTDGTSFSPLSFPALATGAGTATWFLRTATGTIPSTPNLRIRFTNNSGTTQFRLDDIQLQGILVASNTISAPSTPSTVNLANCSSTANTNVTVTSTGTFTAGNNYTAQLSDASGSFASPIATASITDNTNTPPTITLIVPAGTPTGTGYKVRVISNNPSITGTESGTFTINQGGSCSSNASDYFRSKQTGNWNLTSTWESSADNTNWINATLVPNASANIITIQTGHNVTITDTRNFDQTSVNGNLTFGTNATITIADGAGTDLTINGGGVLEYNGTANSINTTFTGTVLVNTNGVLRYTVGFFGGSVAQNLGGTSTNPQITYANGGIFEWNNTGGFGSSNVTYFSTSAVADIPVFRITQGVSSVGANIPNTLTFNGVFEANNNITFTLTADKIFRNGIRGTGTITQQTGSGKFAITGSTAELSGVTLSLNTTNGLSLENNGVVNVNNNITMSSGTIIFLNADLNLNNRNLNLNGGTIQEDLTNSFTIIDNTATTETSKGGAVIYNATVTGVVTNFFNAGLSLNHGGTGDYAITVRRRHYSGGFGQGIKRIYQITGTPSGTSVMTIRYAETELGTLTEPLLISRWQSGTGWQSYTPDVVDFVGNVVTYNNVTAFSDWTLSSQTNALPIQLISFEGKSLGKNTSKITWKTATEIDNQYFILEKSENQNDKSLANNFIKIAQIDAQGNSNQLKEYNFVDNDFQQSAYYRLIQVDYNGTNTEVGLFFLKNENAISLEIFPNPVLENVNLKGEKNAIYMLNIQNLEGKNIFSAKGNLEFLENKIQNQLKTFIPGNYIFIFQNENQKIIKKIVKN